jgi:hypothetical protein
MLHKSLGVNRPPCAHPVARLFRLPYTRHPQVVCACPTCWQVLVADIPIGDGTDLARLAPFTPEFEPAGRHRQFLIQFPP